MNYRAESPITPHPNSVTPFQSASNHPSLCQASDARDGAFDGERPAGVRVRLARLLVWVLPRLTLAVDVKVHAALRDKVEPLFVTIPLLVDLEFASGPVEGERSLIRLLRHVAIVNNATVVEVVQPGRAGGADGLVVDGLVLEGEVDVAAGDLVGGRAEGARCVVVELADSPVTDSGGPGHASLFLGNSGHCGPNPYD